MAEDLEYSHAFVASDFSHSWWLAIVEWIVVKRTELLDDSNATRLKEL